MKLIESVSLWNNGKTSTATVLNAYAVNVSFDKSATFWYGLYSQKEDGQLGDLLTQGNIAMYNPDYDLWETDDMAWNFIANKLNLVVIGDFVPTESLPTSEESAVVE